MNKFINWVLDNWFKLIIVTSVLRFMFVFEQVVNRYFAYTGAMFEFATGLLSLMDHSIKTGLVR